MLLPQLPALQEMGSSWMDYTHTRGVWNSIHTHKQTHMCTHSQTDRHTSHNPGTVAAPHCHRQTDTHVHTLTDKQTDRHTHLSQSWHYSCSTLSDRQTDKHTCTHSQTNSRQTDRHTHLSQSWHCSCSTLSLIMSPLSCSLQKMSCAILRGERKVYSNHYTT